MTAIGTDRLYDLMPVMHRLADIEEGRPLQTLLQAIGEQAELISQSIDRLWDDFFIETCDEWVIPYIGDLVANNLLHDAGARRRVDVARTIYYRRRKGTLPMLEELARDITGWGAHAVEFFELLGWTQNLNHLRFQAGWPDIRDINRMDLIDGPFDSVSHSVDVRPPSTVEGWHNIKNIGFFLYRLRSYPMQGTVLTGGAGVETTIRPQPRVAGAPNLFHFSSLGAPAPLFNHWRREGDEAGLATEPFVPGPIRPLAFWTDLEQLKAQPPGTLQYYGAAGLSGATLDECDISTSDAPSGGSLAVFVDGAEIEQERILCKNLSTWEAPPAGSDKVAIDVALGRLAFAPDANLDGVEVEYHYGFSGDIGGGPYDRRRRPKERDRYKGWGPDTVAFPEVFGGNRLTVAAATADHATIGAALAEWQAAPEAPIVIEVEDDRTYTEDLTIDVTNATVVVIQAANERRPTLLGDITIQGSNDEARVVLDGFVVEGALVLNGNADHVRISHCTLVPGRALDEDGDPTAPDEPSVIADDAGDNNISLSLIVDSSIVGAIRMPLNADELIVGRSIIDGLEIAAIARTGSDDLSACTITVRESTLLGAVHVRRLEMASEVIFRDPVRVERTQEGCVRFSYVEPGSVTPQRYRCQPDLALGVEGLTPAQQARIEARLKPSFTSIHYHDPGYAQLGFHCPIEIKQGAEDGSEMGVWSWLRNPQRKGNLRIRLAEYLPFGLDPALIYVT
jgi:hypothetical protein